MFPRLSKLNRGSITSTSDCNGYYDSAAARKSGSGSGNGNGTDTGTTASTGTGHAGFDSGTNTGCDTGTTDGNRNNKNRSTQERRDKLYGGSVKKGKEWSTKGWFGFDLVCLQHATDALRILIRQSWYIIKININI